MIYIHLVEMNRGRAVSPLDMREGKESEVLPSVASLSAVTSASAVASVFVAVSAA